MKEFKGMNRDEVLEAVLAEELLIEQENERDNLELKKWFIKNCEMVKVESNWGLYCLHSKYLTVKHFRLENIRKNGKNSISTSEFLELMNPTTPKSLLIEGRSVVKFRNGEIRLYAMGGFMDFNNSSIALMNYDENLSCTMNCVIFETEGKRVEEIHVRKDSNGSSGNEDCIKLSDKYFDLVWKREEEKKPVVIDIGITGSLEGIIKNNQTIIINGVELQVRLKD